MEYNVFPILQTSGVTECKTTEWLSWWSIEGDKDNKKEEGRRHLNNARMKNVVSKYVRRIRTIMWVSTYHAIIMSCDRWNQTKEDRITKRMRRSNWQRSSDWECFSELTIDRMLHRPTTNLTLLVMNGVYFSSAVHPMRIEFLWLTHFCHITLDALNEKPQPRSRYVDTRYVDMLAISKWMEHTNAHSVVARDKLHGKVFAFVFMYRFEYFETITGDHRQRNRYRIRCLKLVYLNVIHA